MDIPDWLAPPKPQASPIPPPPPPPPPPLPPLELTHLRPSRRVEEDEGPRQVDKALLFRQFELVFPRVLESICAGMTLNSALKQLPPLDYPIDVGVFTRWMMKDSSRRSLYAEAKEVRAETWTGDMVRHALGHEDDGTPIIAELDRSKFIVDTYKWLVSRQARREYGDTKTIEMNTTISITAALQQATERVITASVIEDDDEPLYLPSGEDEQ